MRSFTKLCVVFIFFALSTSLFAQASASATAQVLAQLKKGLTLTTLGSSDLDFGEIIVTPAPQTPTIAPEFGVKFLASGHPNRNVIVTFGQAILTGGSSSITFTPNVEHTGGASTYTNPSPVTSGGSYQLVNSSGTGFLYLWLGGSLAVAANQEAADYSGTFTMTVAY